VAVLSWSLLLIFLIMAMFGPVLADTDPLRQTPHALLPVGAPGHLLGTDDLGRDELARLLYGARPLLLVSMGSTVLAAVLGVSIGSLAGYAGGRVEGLIMRLIDVALSFPAVLLTILLVAGLGTGLPSLILGIGLSSAPGLARLTRTLTARERRHDYVVAARLGGARAPRIVVGEILPNVAGPILAQAVLTLSIAAGFAAGLSYLGLGVQPPAADWGAMVAAGQEFLYTAPRLVVLPATATLLFVAACNFVGDDLRDALDPQDSVGRLGSGSAG
jgi:peptide/nickel transport system permease protein